MMRGYFAVGCEGISKAANLGAVLRTANAFGASFVFTVGAAQPLRETNATDTSRTRKQIPYYEWDTVADMRLPKDCVLVGVELCDRAVDLPSFRHPKQAAYILGPEKGSLSQDAQDRCAHIIKIPTRFCINVSLACALTLYDRTLSMGGFPPRPLRPGGPGLPELNEWRNRERLN